VTNAVMNVCYTVRGLLGTTFAKHLIFIAARFYPQ
jgi:hypothetical protein